MTSAYDRMGVSAPDIDEKLAMLHREMASLRVECDRLLSKHLIVEHTLSQSCSQWPSAETSSAYNTGGESCRSVSVTPDGAFVSSHNNAGVPQPRLLHRTAKIPSPAVQRRVLPPFPSHPTIVLPHELQSQSMHRSPVIPQRKTVRETAIGLPHAESHATMTTASTAMPFSTGSTIKVTPKVLLGAFKGASLKKFSVAKNISSATCRLNVTEQPRKQVQTEADDYAKRFRIPSYSIVMKEEKRREPEPTKIPMPSFFRSKPLNKIYHFGKPELDEEEEEIEEVVDSDRIAYGEEGGIHYKWKVKRRRDGSKYVVKRPVRNQILKKREAQLNRERAPISTDDDALSELKLGKFHPREERRRQFEREKLKKLLKMQQKMSENPPSDQAILHLSLQKRARQEDKMLMDEFVTTREVLSHRTDGNGIRGVVTVTTV